MSRSARRTLFGFLVVAALTVPPEWLLVTALANSHRSLPEAWVASMTASERRDAAGHIDEYPVAYRRALITALPRETRRRVWVRTADNYVAAHPSMNAEQRALVARVSTLAQTAQFNSVVAKQELRQVAQQVLAELGEHAYRELFYNAGPVSNLADEEAPALPLRLRFESYVRHAFVVSAEAPNCNCNARYPDDCGGNLSTCSQLTDCDFWWVGCGVWYEDTCDGYCS